MTVTDDGLSALLATTAAGGSRPQGHALYVQSWTEPFGSTSPSAFATLYASLGFRWIVMPLVDSTVEVSRELRSRGIYIAAACGIPLVREGWRSAMEGYVAQARRQGAQALVINPEAAWRDHEADARALVAYLNSTGLLTILATYGTPQNIPDFPWAAFARTGIIGAPLLFDRDLRFDAAYFVRGVNGWNERGFNDLIIMGSSWAHGGEGVPEGGRTKTPTELRRHLNQLPVTSAMGIYTTSRMNEEHREILRAWNSGELPSLTGGGELGGAASRDVLTRPAGVTVERLNPLWEAAIRNPTTADYEGLETPYAFNGPSSARNYIARLGRLLRYETLRGHYVPAERLREWTHVARDYFRDEVTDAILTARINTLRTHTLSVLARGRDSTPPRGSPSGASIVVVLTLAGLGLAALASR